MMTLYQPNTATALVTTTTTTAAATVTMILNVYPKKSVLFFDAIDLSWGSAIGFS